MSIRFPVFVLVLALGVGMVGYGLFGHVRTVYEKPSAEDDPAHPNPKSSSQVGEVQLTEWIAKERVVIDEWGHLIDLKTEAICYS